MNTWKLTKEVKGESYYEKKTENGRKVLAVFNSKLKGVSVYCDAGVTYIGFNDLQFFYKNAKELFKE